MKEKDVTRTSIRVNTKLIERFTECAEANGMTKTSCLNMLIAKYIRECEIQNKIIDKLASSESLTDILNNLTPETLEILKK